MNSKLDRTGATAEDVSITTLCDVCVWLVVEDDTCGSTESVGKQVKVSHGRKMFSKSLHTFKNSLRHMRNSPTVMLEGITEKRNTFESEIAVLRLP